MLRILVLAARVIDTAVELDSEIFHVGPDFFLGPAQLTHDQAHGLVGDDQVLQPGFLARVPGLAGVAGVQWVGCLLCHALILFTPSSAAPASGPASRRTRDPWSRTAHR